MTRILVIEDDANIREMMTQALQYEFYEVEVATDGADGLRRASANPPALILCDMMMPIMDGHAVLRRLRAAPRTAHVPFIFVTGLDEREMMRESMNLGADDYLIKPFNNRDLMRAVNMRLEMREKLRAEAGREYEALKLQLARIATHELRTPLISVRSGLDILARQRYITTPEELEQTALAMNVGASRLMHAVDQLVFLTQLDAGLISTDETINGMDVVMWDVVTSAVTQARRFLALTPEDVNVKAVQADPDLRVRGNPAAIKHALAEIVANAFAFGGPTAEVRIVQRRVESNVRISITDNGPGISEDKLTLALTAFRQLDREKREQQGLGLGLALAQRLAEVHRGEIEIRSVVGRGTRVLFILPEVI
jgi:signal transduction histidine kinase